MHHFVISSSSLFSPQVYFCVCIVFDSGHWASLQAESSQTMCNIQCRHTQSINSDRSDSTILSALWWKEWSSWLRSGNEYCNLNLAIVSCLVEPYETDFIFKWDSVEIRVFFASFIILLLKWKWHSENGKLYLFHELMMTIDYCTEIEIWNKQWDETNLISVIILNPQRLVFLFHLLDHLFSLASVFSFPWLLFGSDNLELFPVIKF